MQQDFHYYATYAAACLAGYSHEESLTIGYSDEMCDHFTPSFLEYINAPLESATTQDKIDLANSRTDRIGLQEITRIWASFHFLPGNLEARPGRASKGYRQKYALICNPNGSLVADIVNLAKGESLQHVGIAMHTLADTWAHRYFAGTPSVVINNMPLGAVEIVTEDGRTFERPISFGLSTGGDDLENSRYISSPYQPDENGIFNLGHGHCGHLPDYGFIRYRYTPSWGNYGEVLKDNPKEYYNAFCQMVYAMRYLRGDIRAFELDRYDYDLVAPYKDQIDAILAKRQLDASQDWKAFGESISGHQIDAFDEALYINEYMGVSEAEKEDTFIGRFVLGALAQKSIVTNRIYRTGNRLAGRSIELVKDDIFRGITAYMHLFEHRRKQL